MFELKEYQKETLGVLREYLEEAAVRGPKAAFGKVAARHPSDVRPSVYHARWDMEDVPYVCLRLPTGGGKTLLAAHSVGVAAGTYLHREHPFVLWLVPTNTIRKQTVEALQNVSHPYREALDAEFGLQGVRVFDIEDINNIRPPCRRFAWGKATRMPARYMAIMKILSSISSSFPILIPDWTGGMTGECCIPL